MRILYITVIGLVVALSAFGWDEKPKPWDELKHCRLMENYSNDGDSFHVNHDGKEFIFRLCFVDCPESSDSIHKRVEEQAKWWGISNKSVVKYGHEATRFTKNLLKGEFTVFTRYEDARGRSALKRNFAMIRVGDGFLSEELVKAGLARTYGYPVVLPTGEHPKAFRAHLDQLELEARGARRGAWAETNLEPVIGAGENKTGREIKLKGQVTLYADPSGNFMGNLKPGTVVFVPDQPKGAMLKLRAPFRGRVVNGQCRRWEIETAGYK